MVMMMAMMMLGWMPLLFYKAVKSSIWQLCDLSQIIQ